MENLKKQVISLVERELEFIELETNEKKPSDLFRTFIPKYYATIYKKHYLEIFSEIKYLEEKNKIYLEQTLLEVEDYINDYNNNQKNKEFKYPINKKLYEIDSLVKVLNLNQKEKINSSLFLFFINFRLSYYFKI